jgi:hypothetical protein
MTSTRKITLPIFIGALALAQGPTLGDISSRADTPTPFDQRACVCDAMSTAPRDIFTARSISTPDGNRLEVVEILTHGITERQVPGEIMVGLERLSGSIDGPGPFLLYEQHERNEFCGISISSFDIDAAGLRTLFCFAPPGSKYDRSCTTEFKIAQLKPFAEAFAEGEGTCPALATKYLGVPKPPPEDADNFPQYLCGGGAAPGSFLLILGALGVLAFRRRRPSSPLTERA